MLRHYTVKLFFFCSLLLFYALSNDALPRSGFPTKYYEFGSLEMWREIGASSVACADWPTASYRFERVAELFWTKPQSITTNIAGCSLVSGDVFSRVVMKTAPRKRSEIAGGSGTDIMG